LEFTAFVLKSKKATSLKQPNIFSLFDFHWSKYPAVFYLRRDTMLSLGIHALDRQLARFLFEQAQFHGCSHVLYAYRSLISNTPAGTFSFPRVA
jgi:hypothetical protein